MKPEIKHLTNAELTMKIKSLTSQEQLLNEENIWHITEVDQRKMYLEIAYASLFEYLTVEIGYSAGSAQRRIDAARLVQKLPEVSEEIKSGNLNLGQIAQMKRIERQMKKRLWLHRPTQRAKRSSRKDRE